MEVGILRPKSPQIHHSFPQFLEILRPPLVLRPKTPLKTQQHYTKQQNLEFEHTETLADCNNQLDCCVDTIFDDGNDFATKLQSRLPFEHTTPKRQESKDSAYESVRGDPDVLDRGGNIHIDVQAQNLRARERLEIYRGRVIRTRYLLNESSRKVQVLRGRFQDATDHLMRAINKLMVQEDAQSLRNLSPLHDAVRNAQADLGPAEHDFDLLLLRMNREEDDLEEEEDYFYTHNNVVLSPVTDSAILDHPLTPIREPYNPENEEFPNLNLDHELIQQYLDKRAQAEQLKEQLDALESKHFDLMEELAFRSRHKLLLADDKKEYLFEFPELRIKAIKNLEAVEYELYEIRERCIAEYLFTSSEYPYEPHDALVEDIWVSINDALGRSPLRIATQDRPDVLLSREDFKDKRDYVNTWMWEWIQDSTLEKVRMKEHIMSESPNLEAEEDDEDDTAGEKWSDLSLQLWYHDEAGMSTQDDRNLSTMDALLGGSATRGYASGSGSLLVDFGDEPFEEWDPWESFQVTTQSLFGKESRAAQPTDLNSNNGRVARILS